MLQYQRQQHRPAPEKGKLTLVDRVGSKPSQACLGQRLCTGKVTQPDTSPAAWLPPTSNEQNSSQAPALSSQNTTHR